MLDTVSDLGAGRTEETGEALVFAGSTKLFCPPYMVEHAISNQTELRFAKILARLEPQWYLCPIEAFGFICSCVAIRPGS